MFYYLQNRTLDNIVNLKYDRNDKEIVCLFFLTYNINIFNNSKSLGKKLNGMSFCNYYEDITKINLKNIKDKYKNHVHNAFYHFYFMTEGRGSGIYEYNY